MIAKSGITWSQLTGHNKTRKAKLFIRTMGGGGGHVGGSAVDFKQHRFLRDLSSTLRRTENQQCSSSLMITNARSVQDNFMLMLARMNGFFLFMEGTHCTHSISMCYLGFCVLFVLYTLQLLTFQQGQTKRKPPPSRVTSLSKQTVKVDCIALSELLTTI